MEQNWDLTRPRIYCVLRTCMITKLLVTNPMTQGKNYFQELCLASVQRTHKKVLLSRGKLILRVAF
jgi:hypothetical protein